MRLTVRSGAVLPWLIGAALGAMPPPALSSVTLYGIVDAAVEYSNADANTTSSGAGSSTLRLINGGHSPSRLGLRGVEDLGAGLRAIFTIEHGLDLDTGSISGTDTPTLVQFWNRQAWVGLQGAWGTFTLGRQYSLLWDTLAATEPTGYGFYENLSKAFNDRVDNTVKYLTPSFGGLTGYALYGFGENTTGADTDVRGLGVRWSIGRLVGGASWTTYGQASGDDRYEAGVGAAWVFSPTTQLGGGLVRTDLATGAVVDYWYVSGSLAALGGVIYLNYQYVDPKAGTSGQNLGVAWSYSFSKRTTGYVAYGMQTDVPAGTFGPVDPMRLAVGMRHLF